MVVRAIWIGLNQTSRNITLFAKEMPSEESSNASFLALLRLRLIPSIALP